MCSWSRTREQKEGRKYQSRASQVSWDSLYISRFTNWLARSCSLATSHASEGRIESCCLVHMRDASSAVMLCSQYRRHLPSAILRRGLLSDIRPAATRPKGMLSINRCSQPLASSPLLAPPGSDLVSGHCLKSSESVVPCCFGLQGVLHGLVTLR